MKKKLEKCLPLEVLQTYLKLYPDAFEFIETCRDKNLEERKLPEGERSLPVWNSDCCYVPIGVSQVVVDTSLSLAEANFGIPFSESHKMEVIMNDAQILSALAPWRQSKEIFDLDPDMEEVLIEQDGDLNLPSEVLMRLPYYCFYVKTSKLKMGEDSIDGFFVYLEQDLRTDVFELRLMALDKVGKVYVPMSFPIHLDEPTLSDSLQAALEQSEANVRSMETEDKDYILCKLHSYESVQKDILKTASQMIQIVLYILSTNSEQEQNKKPVKRTAMVKDKYAEIRKWDVGRRTGATFRKIRSVSITPKKADLPHTESVLGDYHARKRPHTRRAHYHAYWMGSEKKGDRRLTVKWLPPMAINPDDDDTPVVDHKLDA